MSTAEKIQMAHPLYKAENRLCGHIFIFKGSSKNEYTIIAFGHLDFSLCMGIREYFEYK